MDLFSIHIYIYMHVFDFYSTYIFEFNLILKFRDKES